MRTGTPSSTRRRSGAGSESSPNSAVSANQLPPKRSSGRDPVGVCNEPSRSSTCSGSTGSLSRTFLALRYTWRSAAFSRFSRRFRRVSAHVVPASRALSMNAPSANASVTRTRSPNRAGRKCQLWSL